MHGVWGVAHGVTEEEGSNGLGWLNGAVVEFYWRGHGQEIGMAYGVGGSQAEC